MQTAFRYGIAGVAAAIYAVSLALPTAAPFNPQFSTTTYNGLDALQTSGQSLMAGEFAERDWWVMSAVFLANPAIWVAIIAAWRGYWWIGTAAAGSAVNLALLVLPHYGGIVMSLPGYWTWLGSAAFLLVACVWKARREWLQKRVKADRY